MPFSIADVRTQADAMRRILAFVERGSYDPIVRRVALQIVEDCKGRDDLCEVSAIFDAVKHGTDRVPALRNGLKYVADPRAVDFYMGARRILEEAARGANGADCDDHTILVGSLLAALGYKVGARAWGPDPRRNEYVHIYPIVAIPKKGPWPAGYTGHGLDTTVDKSEVGWEPPRRRMLTMWIEEDEG